MKTLGLILVLLAGRGAETERWDVAVPMRDGKTLRADVYLPPRPGKFPAVLVQTPYDKRHFRPPLTGPRGGSATPAGGPCPTCASWSTATATRT